MTPADMLAMVGERVLSAAAFPAQNILRDDPLEIVGANSNVWLARVVRTGTIQNFTVTNVRPGPMTTDGGRRLLLLFTCADGDAPQQSSPPPAGQLGQLGEAESLRADCARLRNVATAQSSLLIGLRMELADVKGERDRLAGLEVEVAWLRRENVRLTGKNRKPW